MLSNLASYFLGYGGEEAQAATSPEPTTQEGSVDDSTLRLTAVETDEDDWIMVEKTERRGEVEEEQKEERERGEWSRSGSSTSLPCLSLEESWFLTPPPCFTSTGPVTLETSPLENLLIEHPSMSVYQGRGFPHPSAPAAPPRRARSLSPPQRPAPNDGSPPPQPPAPHHNSRSPLHPNYYHNVQRQAFSLQKQKTKKEGQCFKGKQLEKCNKVKEVNKRNKRPRRSDRQKNHSGANNNRKC